MELFDNLELEECVPEPLDVQTSLGTIELSATVDEQRLTAGNSTQFYALADSAFSGILQRINFE